MRLSRVTAAVAALCILGFATPAAAGSHNRAGGPRSASSVVEGVPRFGHVFMIIGENTTYSHLTTVNAPYLMGTLRPNSAWLTQYYAATHWSQANYVALTSGQYTNCQQHDLGIACHQNVDNIFHQLDASGQTWKTWLEAGTAKCDTGSGGSCASNVACPLSGFYTTGNPATGYDDVEGPNGVWSTTPSQECLADDVPAGTPSDGMATFNGDLKSGNVPDFNLIIPNGCEDGESNCKPVNNRYTQFDDFLAREVPLIEASPAFGSKGVIVVVYDEDERAGGVAAKNGFGSGGHVVCAVVSPLATPGSYGGTFYHYSLLRTIEDGFGLSGHVGYANDVGPINTIWGTPRP